MKKIKLEDIRDSYGATDWRKVGQLIDAEIEAAAAKSKDAGLLTESELAEMRRASDESDVDI